MAIIRIAIGATLAALLFTLAACEPPVVPDRPSRTPNRAPTAHAGADQTVSAGALVFLEGSATDDGADLTYAWNGPAGITLTGADSRFALFTAPSVSVDTAFEFTLTVTDSGGLSGTDDVTVTVEASEQTTSPSFGTQSVPNQAYTEGTAIDALTLPTQQFSVRGSWRPGKKVWGPTRPSGGEGT